MADGFVIDVSELGDLAAELAAAAGLVGTVASDVQNRYGDLVVKEAKRLAPVDTGALQRSIQVDRTSEAARLGLVGVRITADTRPETGRGYSGYVEFGTSRMRPQPFMRPALRKYAAAYRRDLVDAAARLVGSKRGARRKLAGKSLYRGAGSFTLGKAIERNR